ncbi:TetR/AcrR family transcriptional regulator [Arthrobacter sp. JSM 101049]|uniref:TetR/AcrR family transcriptional regulator n=1 Tax=Arthrobacter sp. JSM 101049 TaxID=929097 RepID=UPI00356B3D00
MKREPLSRTRLVGAAAELADHDGFAAVTVTALARQVGVKPASIYSHVEDLAALLEGIHELALGELADHVAGAIAGRSGRDALAGMAQAHRDYAGRHPGRWAAMQRPAGPAVAGSPAARKIVEYTWAVLRAYGLPEPELVHATRFVGATINGYLALEKAGSFEHRAEHTDLSWQRAVNALDRALQTWTEAHPEGTA